MLPKTNKIQNKFISICKAKKCFEIGRGMTLVRIKAYAKIEHKECLEYGIEEHGVTAKLKKLEWCFRSHTRTDFCSEADFPMVNRCRNDEAKVNKIKKA